MSPGLDPFVDGADENSYFVTPALRQRIDLVRHLLEFGRQIIVLTGAGGAGKTSLLDAIAASNDGRFEIIRLVAGPTLSRAVLLSRIAGELGIDDDGDVLRNVRMFTAAANRRGETTVLAIDDADALPSDTAACLVELAHASDPGEEIKVVVTADPGRSSVVDQLQREGSEKTLVHVVEIPGFNDEHLGAMLEFRWRAAYGDAEFPFAPIDIAQIRQQSNGLPGKALVLARQIQRMADNPARTERDPAQRFLLLGILVIAMLVVIAFVNSLRPDAPVVDATGDERPAGVETPAPDTGTSTKRVVELELPPPLPDAAPPSGVSVTPVAPLPAPAAETVPPAAATPPRPVADSTAVPATPAVAPASASAGAPALETKPPPAPAKAPPRTGAPANAIAVAPAGAAKPERVPAKPAAKPPAPEPVPAPRPAARAVEAPYTVAWLRAHARGKYVLQLFGVRDRLAAVRFRERHGITDKSDILTTQHGGAAWYVVVYGLYPDRQAAQAAIARLPRELAATSPWARPVDTLE